MKTYKITFMAELSEDDVRAMNKCFFDAMNESMNIYSLWGLKLEEIKDSGDSILTLEDLLKIPMDHIQKVKDCFAACKSRDDVYTVLRFIPGMFGSFTVEFDPMNKVFTVVNTYFDGQLNDEYEEEYEFDYPDDWDYDEEDEEELDELYHDCSEEELRRMGCFDNLDEDFCDDPDVDEELLAMYKKEGED